MSHTQNAKTRQRRVQHDFVGAPVNTSGTVNISRLKDFVAEKLPVGSPLREVILGDDVELDSSIFLARLPVWLQLSRLKIDRGPSHA
jgi:hypothetical protein